MPRSTPRAAPWPPSSSAPAQQHWCTWARTHPRCRYACSERPAPALVTVPPYHVAGVTNLVSNLYAGRRIVYLDSFDAATWLETVRREHVTQAMVVPTMLARVVDLIGDAPDAGVPTLRSLSYGG